MPWKYEVDTAADDLAKIRLQALALEKEADALGAMAQERLRTIKKTLDGEQGGAGSSAAVPDLTKFTGRRPRPSFAEPRNPMAPQEQSSSMNQALAHEAATLFPGDVKTSEQLAQVREAHRADLEKAARPDPVGFLPNAISAFTGPSVSLAKYIASLGVVAKPDVAKAGPRFVGGAGKREANTILPEAERLNREIDMLRQLAHLNLDQPVVESTVTRSIEGGLLRDPRVLSVISQTPGFSNALRELAAEAAERAQRQDASQQGMPYLQRAESF